MKTFWVFCVTLALSVGINFGVLIAKSKDAERPVIGSYTGDGAPERVIDLGFAPSYGFLYATDPEPMIEYNFDMYYTAQSLGIISAEGDSYGLRRLDNGFAVDYYEGSAAHASMPYFNRSGVKYVYLMWE